MTEEEFRAKVAQLTEAQKKELLAYFDLLLKEQEGDTQHGAERF